MIKNQLSEVRKMNHWTTCPSPIGTITLACSDDNLSGLWLDGQKYHSAGMPKSATKRSDLPIFGSAMKWLDRYFSGENPSLLELPLSPVGSLFRQGVWGILREIPYGEVTTYGDIAKKMAARMGLEHMSAQAVGGAVGHNPISIIIPCHRVVGTGGSLTGYAGGIGIKVKLLEAEGVDMSQLSVPKKGTAL